MILKSIAAARFHCTKNNLFFDSKIFLQPKAFITFFLSCPFDNYGRKDYIKHLKNRSLPEKQQQDKYSKTDLTMYSMTNEISFSRCGADGKLKLGEAVAMMIDCCQFQEYQEVDFRNFLTTNNIAVFLSSLQLDIIRMPSFREKVTTTVKIYGCRSFYGLRRLTMHDEKGDLCLIGNATGAFFDLNVMKAVKIDPEKCGLLFDKVEDMECLNRKIPLPQISGHTIPALRVKRSGLDSNGHLTSSAYFTIAEDILPENFSYNRIRLEYKHQAKYDALILPVLYQTENAVIIDMKSGTGISFCSAEFSTYSIAGN